MFKFLVYRFGQFCVTRLPLTWSYRIATFLSDCHYYMSFRDRRAVENNLKVILSAESDLSIETREVFRNFGKYLVEFFRMAYELDDLYVQEKLKVKNIENLKKVLDKGKGAIILSAHIGNWELGGVLISHLGYPFYAIALPHKERPVNDLFNKQRELRGVVVVPSNHAIRRSYKAFKENAAVAVVGDRDFTLNGEVVDFLGRKALLPKGAALFAYKTGAGIVPTFMIRDKNDTFTLHFEEPIYPSHIIKGEVNRQDLIAMMKRYIPVIEEKIRAYPTQWLMFRQFWVNL